MEHIEESVQPSKKPCKGIKVDATENTPEAQDPTPDNPQAGTTPDAENAKESNVKANVDEAFAQNPKLTHVYAAPDGTCFFTKNAAELYCKVQKIDKAGVVTHARTV